MARAAEGAVELLPYDVGPARVFLGEAEKTPMQGTMCGLGPASRVNRARVRPAQGAQLKDSKTRVVKPVLQGYDM